MQNGRKQEIILIRVINTDYSMDTVWDGQRQLCISLPAKYRSAVREISVCRSGGQMLMELRADKTEKYQITPGASVSLGGQADLRAEISVLPELRVVRYSLAGMRSIQIGRSSRSDIVLNDDRASRAHTMLTYESGIYTLSDLNSTNGTFVNGTRIKKTYLHDGDTFRIADSYFLFEREQLYWSSRPIKNVHAADVFKPAPQMRMMPETQEISITRPPQKVAKTEINWLSVLLPTLLSALVLGGVSMIGGSSYGLMMLPLQLVGVVMSVINHRSQTKKAVTAEGSRQEKYEAYLNDVTKTLQEAHDKQLAALQRENPSADICAEILKNRTPELWSRNPKNENFYAVRLGTGDVTATVCAQFAADPFSGNEDPLQTRAAELADQSKLLTDAPVVLQGQKNCVVGIVGDRKLTDQMQQNLLIQLSTLCASTDLRFAAFAPGKSWRWLRWLPHMQMPKQPGYMLAIGDSNADETARALRESMEKTGEGQPAPNYCVFIPEGGCFDHALLKLTADEKNRASIRFFISCRSIAELPKECTPILELHEDTCVFYNSNDAQTKQIFRMDAENTIDCGAFARTLAGIRREDDQAGGKIPDSITFMDGYGLRRAEDWNLQKAWSSARPEQSLAVPIGVDEYGKTFLFNVLEGKDGVHGLVGGTAGSGKSEMLQTWILSMAMHFSPQDVSFVIVDFKGSGLLTPLAKLPHLAGTISNLDKDVKRNADSLRHEIERRESLFKKYGAINFADYRRMERANPEMEHLALLIVVIDEFAELKKMFPYFSDVVVKSGYPVGRALSIYFTLATQQPESVTELDIRKNIHYKWLLKVPDAGTSKAEIGVPDAAHLSNPGRAFIFVDNPAKAKELTLVQSFWSGAKYRPGAFLTQQQLAFVDLTGQRIYAKTNKDAADTESITQIEKLVGYIRQYADENHIPDAQQVWLEKLPDRFSLTQMQLERTDGLCPVIGRIDDPKNQTQYPLCVDFTGSGHMVVYGALVTGKTTFLQTLMMALVTRYTPEKTQIYAMDFGGSYGLRPFAGFPHVGGIADAEEEEKLKRLAKLLTQEQARRKKLFASLGIGSIRSYRQMERLEQLKPLPELVLIVDNFRAALGQYPELEEFFLDLVQKGANFGMYLAASVAGSNALPTKFNDYVKTVFTLQQTDRSKYSDLVGKTDVYPEENVGRGLVKRTPPLEFQVALPTDGENDAEITVHIKQLAAKQRRTWNGICAAPIPIMPGKITADEIVTDQIALGLFKDTIEPVIYDENQQFYLLISAAEEKRGHELLMLLAQQMKEKRDCEVWCFDPVQDCALLQKNADRYLTVAEEIDQTIADLMPVMSGRKKEKQNNPQAVFEPLLLVVADYDSFHAVISEQTAERMELLLRLSQGLGVYILAECSADKLVRLGALDTIKIMQRGGQAVLLGGCIEQHYGFQTDSLNLSYAQKNTAVQKDEGFFLKDGRLRIFKAITAQEKEV